MKIGMDCWKGNWEGGKELVLDTSSRIQLGNTPPNPN